MQSPFERFLAQRSSDLRRISRADRGEYTPDELASECWILADEIGNKRGFPFDFASEDDRDTLLAWLYTEVVRYADKSVRYAVKLDKGWDSDDDERTGETLARLLTAPPESDPQLRHQAHDEEAGLLVMVDHSYSQASAYVVLLVRLEWDFGDLANLLWVSAPTARDRVKAAGLLVRLQPSLFDGIERIARDFEPRARHKAAVRRFGHGDSTQAALALPHC